MSTPGIKTKISFDGEKEYKQAISEINSGLGVLSSEMKKTTAEFKANSTSIEALTAKGDVLDRTLSSQKEKVEKLQAALTNAHKEYGEADSRTMKWQKSLNEAQAALFETENAIEENNKALEEASKATEGATMTVDDLCDAVGIHLPKTLKDAVGSLGDFSVKGVAAAGAVAAAVAAVNKGYKELISMTLEAASNADNILTLSQITGFSTESIQELQYSAELIDVSFDTISSSMTKLKNNMQSARDGSSTLTEAFDSIGVAVTDAEGNLRDAQDVFYDVINALGDVENATERDALAMDLMGKSAQDLNPLIVQGTDTLKGYAEEAHNVGAVLNDEQLAALGAVDDAYQRLQATQEAVKQQIAAEMAPAVEEFYTAWTDFMQRAGQALVESGLIDNLARILQCVTDLLTPANRLKDDTIPGIQQQLTPLQTALNGVSLLIAGIADAINVISNFNLGGLISGRLGDALGMNYGKGVANNYQRTKLIQSGDWEQYSSFYGVNASGDANWRGGMTWVGENGPELVRLPQGSQIYSNQESREMSMGGDTFNITIDAKSVKEFNDIIAMAKNARMMARKEG